MHFNLQSHTHAEPVATLDGHDPEMAKTSRTVSRILRHDPSYAPPGSSRGETIYVDRGGLADIEVVARRLNLAVPVLVELCRQNPGGRFQKR